MAQSNFQFYNYKGKTYTLDTHNWQMTVFDKGEEFGIGGAKLVAEVMTLGEKIERK